jgi:tetratricopeptide (TPR) repeat protein
MTHPTLEGFRQYANDLEQIKGDQSQHAVALQQVYDATIEYPQYCLLSIVAATSLANLYLSQAMHDQGLNLVNATLESLQEVHEYYGTREQERLALHALVIVKLRILTCYRTDEFDEAILTITVDFLKQYPNLIEDDGSLLGAGFANARGRALNRQGRHADAVALYRRLVEAGTSRDEALVRDMGSLGFAESATLNAKQLAINGDYQGATLLWTEAISAFDHWLLNLPPDTEADSIFVANVLWGSAYCKWLSGESKNTHELLSIYAARPQVQRQEFMADVVRYQNTLDQELLDKLISVAPHALDVPGDNTVYLM